MSAEKSPAHRLGIIDRELRKATANPSYHLTKKRLLSIINDEFEMMGEKPVKMRSLELDLTRIQKVENVDLVKEWRPIPSGEEGGPGTTQSVVNRVCYAYKSKDMSLASRSSLHLSEYDRIKLQDAFRFMLTYAGWEGFDCVSGHVTELKELFLGQSGLGQTHILVDHSEYAGRNMIPIMNDAILDKTVLDVAYEPFGKSTVTYRFHPHVLKRYNGRWFCIGFNQTTGYWKTVLALDRISHATQVSMMELSKESESINRNYRPQDFSDGESWVDHFFHSLGPTVKDEAPQKVTVRFEAVKSKRAYYVHTKPLHHTQKPSTNMPAPDKNGWCEFTYTVIPNPEFYSTLLSFGANAEIVSPSHIRDEFREKTQALAVIYGR